MFCTTSAVLPSQILISKRIIFQLTLFVYLAISAATSAEAVGICKSPAMNDEELPDWAVVDDEGGSFTTARTKRWRN